VTNVEIQIKITRQLFHVWPISLGLEVFLVIYQKTTIKPSSPNKNGIFCDKLHRFVLLTSASKNSFFRMTHVARGAKQSKRAKAHQDRECDTPLQCVRTTNLSDSADAT
jgi:hypothetical protein